MRGSDRHRRSVLGSIATAGAVSVAGCLGGGGDGDGDDGNGSSLTLGSGTQGSATMAAAQALQRALDEYSDEVSISTQQTQGAGPANFRVFDQGETDGGGYDNFSAPDAYEGTGEFEDNPVEDVPHQGFYWLTIQLFMLAREDVDIEDADDIEGLNVYLNPAGVGVRPPIDTVLKNAGYWDEIETFEMDRADVAGALQEERVDVIFVYGLNNKGLPGWVTEVETQIDLKGVPGTDTLKQAVDDTPGIPYVEADPDDFGFSQDLGVDTIPAWEQAYQFRFGGHVDAEAIEEIARVAHEQNDYVIEADSNFAEFETAEDMTYGVIDDQPIHEGMANYWQANDAWDDSWTVGE